MQTTAMSTRQTTAPRALFTKAKPVVKAPEPAPKKGGLFSFGKKQQPAKAAPQQQKKQAAKPAAVDKAAEYE